MRLLAITLGLIITSVVYGQDVLNSSSLYYPGKTTVWDLSYIDKGEAIIAAGADGSLIKINNTDLKEIWRKKVQDGPIHDLDISTNDSLIAVANYSKGFGIYNAHNLSEIIVSNQFGGVDLLKWIPESTNEIILLTTGDTDSKLVVFNTEKKEITKTIFKANTSSEHPVELNFSRNGKLLAVGTANKNHAVHFYDTKDWNEVKTLKTSADVNAFEWDNDDSSFYIGTLDDVVEKYKYSDLSQEWKAEYGSSFPSSMDINKQGQLAVCGFQYGFTIKIYDGETGKELQSIGERNPRGNAVRWNPEGDQLAFGITTYGDAFTAGIIQVFNSPARQANIPWFETDSRYTGFPIQIPMSVDPTLKSDSYYSYATYNISYGDVSYQVYGIKLKRSISESQAAARVSRATSSWKSRKSPEEFKSNTIKANGYTISEITAKKGRYNYFVRIMHNGSYELTLTAKTKVDKNADIQRFLGEK